MPSEVEKRRIDLLALDRAGRAVIIELKLGNDEKHLFQALSYAAMLSKWTSENFLRLLTSEQREGLDDFLDAGSAVELNMRQRVILIAEAFDYQTLIAAERLSEQYGVDIACCRISLAVDQTGEFLTCSQILPAPELASQALRSGGNRAAAAVTKSRDWESILGRCKNAAVTKFFRERLEAGQHNRPAKGDIGFSQAGGKKGWYVAVQQNRANVFQKGSFDGDLDFWRDKISDPNTLTRRPSGVLTFNLSTEQDFSAFQQAMKTVATNIRLTSTELRDDEDAENDSLDME